MSQITYVSVSETKVYVDGKLTGTIRLTPGGYQYTPKGGKSGGEFYATLGMCKASLEEAP